MINEMRNLTGGIGSRSEVVVVLALLCAAILNPLQVSQILVLFPSNSIKSYVLLRPT